MRPLWLTAPVVPKSFCSMKNKLYRISYRIDTVCTLVCNPHLFVHLLLLSLFLGRLHTGLQLLQLPPKHLKRGGSSIMYWDTADLTRALSCWCWLHDSEGKCLLAVRGSFSIYAFMWVIPKLCRTLVIVIRVPKCNLIKRWCGFAAHEQLYLDLNVFVCRIVVTLIYLLDCNLSLAQALLLVSPSPSSPPGATPPSSAPHSSVLVTFWNPSALKKKRFSKKTGWHVSMCVCAFPYPYFCCMFVSLPL